MSRLGLAARLMSPSMPGGEGWSPLDNERKPGGLPRTVQQHGQGAGAWRLPCSSGRGARPRVFCRHPGSPGRLRPGRPGSRDESGNTRRRAAPPSRVTWSGRWSRTGRDSQVGEGTGRAGTAALGGDAEWSHPGGRRRPGWPRLPTPAPLPKCATCTL